MNFPVVSSQHVTSSSDLLWVFLLDTTVVMLSERATGRGSSLWLEDQDIAKPPSAKDWAFVAMMAKHFDVSTRIITQQLFNDHKNQNHRRHDSMINAKTNSIEGP